MPNYFKKIKRSSGFTLVELLVVLAVFSTSMMVAMQIFYGVTRTQRQTSATQKVQGDARFVMESMAREARLGTINYGYYPHDENGNIIYTQDKHTDVLATVDQDGNQVVYKHIYDDPLDSYIEVSNDGGASWSRVTPTGITITRLQFYIYPAKPTTNDQPRVTIVLSAEGADPRVREQLKLDLQTTVSSRWYSR